MLPVWVTIILFHNSIRHYRHSRLGINNSTWITEEVRCEVIEKEVLFCGLILIVS